MTEKTKSYPVQDSWKKNTWCTEDQYQKLYQASIQDPENFWATQAERITWKKKWNSVKNCSFTGDVHIRWFEGAKLNVSENCLDRHLPQYANDVAFIWEPDSPTEKSISITYQELYKKVCQFSNALKKQGVKKGDRVTLYLPMIPEAVISMLACTRIGAVHSIVFGGFSPESITQRINDCESSIVITADEGFRAGKTIALKKNVDEALELYFEDSDAPKIIGAFVEMTFSKTIGVVPTSGKVVSVSQGC